MRKAICLLVAFVLLATSLAAATSKVTNVTMTYQNGYTVARIDIDGTVRFSHQTEVAKDGKPFRVIVDILKATHHLGAKKFMSLPKCPVKAIRTSQYAISPEAVVRLVFDMAQEASYRVESNQQSVTVTFPDKSGHKFAVWSTSQVVAAMNKSTQKTVVAAKVEAPSTSKSSKPMAPRKKSPAEVNSAINKDRMASLASKNQPQVTNSKRKSGTSSKPLQTEKASSFPTSTFSPSTGQFSDQDKWADLYKKSAPTAKGTSAIEVKSNKDKTSLAASGEPAPTVTRPVSKPKTKLAAIPPKSQTGAVTSGTKEVVASPKAEPKHAVSKPKTKLAAIPPKSQTGAATSGTKKVVASPKAEPKHAAGKKATDKMSHATPKTLAKVNRPRNKSEGNVKPPATSENTIKNQKQVSGKSDSKTVAQTNKSKKNTKSTNKSGSKTVAKVDKTDAARRSTSRFRRNPTVSKKIKGTMVAEFPKRLVVKYKTRQYRDPFATLINEAQVSTSPIEQKVPNVEGLRLVGILESEGGKNSALLEDGSGYGYILKTGDRVKKGYVLRIEADQVFFQIFEYGWSRTLALHIEE